MTGPAAGGADTTPRVRLGNGVRIDLASGETVVADGSASAAGDATGDADGGEVAVVSHAHTDHLAGNGAGGVVCSALTADLAAVRGRGSDPLPRRAHPAIDLVNAGHVAGSRAALVDDGEHRVLYTGDCSVRDRAYLEGFDPPEADVLILETTYGVPRYTMPAQAAVEARILDWLADTMDVPVLLFGYALGRAQKLQWLVGRSERTRLLATEAVREVNAVIERHRDLDFGASPLASVDRLEPGDAVVLPSASARSKRVRERLDGTDHVTAGFSGWAVEESYRYRTGSDVTFPLTDHCDFNDLERVVEAVDPDRVYTHHGFADEFAQHCESELGVPAQSLKPNQAALTDF